jgi:Aspartyl/Asparaginyl beta-hydroxylase
MLDLPTQPVLDKARLIGGCARLPLAVDAAVLREEVARLDPALWGSRGGRVGVHRVAEAVFLRGHAPAEGELPIEDRPALDALPGIRALIERRIGATPMRCLLARLPPGAIVAPHIDRAPYFSKTIRIHVPIDTHPRAWMIASNLVYQMQAGEVWALNNSAMHGVWNEGTEHSRTHLICDFLLSPMLEQYLSASERDLGRSMPEVLRHLAAA